MAGEGDGFEPAVRVFGEAGHRAAVVHPPAILGHEVAADLATGQRSLGGEAVITGWVVVEVMHAEQEGVDGRPLEAERDGLQHDRGSGHPLSL